MTNEPKPPVDGESERRRAAARRDWPISIYRLGEEPGDDLSATTTAEERIAMVWPLTLEAWRVAGLEIPTYERSEAPIRIIRPFPPRKPEDDEGS